MRRKTDERQLDLQFKPAEKAKVAPDVQNEKISTGAEIRTEIMNILRPGLSDRKNPKLSRQLAFLMYLLADRFESDTVVLTQAHIKMMEKLGIGIRYRNDGATDISLNTHDLSVIYPDGIEGNLTVDKGARHSFIFNKNCKRNEDRKPIRF